MNPSWSDVEVSLDAWDPEPVERAVLDALITAVGSGPPVPREANRVWPYPKAVREALSEAIGPWYALGPQVGDETVSGWCWCHAFWAPFEGRSVGPGLEAVARGVMVEVEICRAWRIGLAGFLREMSPIPGVEPEVLESDLLALVGVLVELGIHDSWYQHVHVAAGWMLQARGLPVPPDLADALEGIAGARFTSWSAPSAAARQEFAQQAAWAAVERLLDAR